MRREKGRLHKGRERRGGGQARPYNQTISLTNNNNYYYVLLLGNKDSLQKHYD